jgi:hypothetical protein
LYPSGQGNALLSLAWGIALRFNEQSVPQALKGRYLDYAPLGLNPFPYFIRRALPHAIDFALSEQYRYISHPHQAESLSS